MDDIARQNEILAVLKQHTADKEILSHYKQVALTQEDLADLLDDEVTPIYLCGEQFSIPLSLENRKYIGILGTPKIKITAKTAEELTARGITFENVNMPENLLPKPEIVEVVPGRAIIDGFPNRHQIRATMLQGTFSENSKIRIFSPYSYPHYNIYDNTYSPNYIHYNTISGLDYSGDTVYISPSSRFTGLDKGDIIEAYDVEESKSE